MHDLGEAEREDEKAERGRTAALGGDEHRVVEGDGEKRRREDPAAGAPAAKEWPRETSSKATNVPEGGELAVREVEDAGAAVDEHEPEGHERVEAPRGEPGHQEGQEALHQRKGQLSK